MKQNHLPDSSSVGLFRAGFNQNIIGLFGRQFLKHVERSDGIQLMKNGLLFLDLIVGQKSDFPATSRKPRNLPQL